MLGGRRHGHFGSLGAPLGDPNGDGRPDLFVSNVGPRTRLVNDGDGAFDAAVAAGAVIPIDDHHLAIWERCSRTFTPLGRRTR